jgi:hypothetical protein
MNKKQIIENNKALIEKYPFLLPKNRFTGKASEDYDYSYTELDSMPNGWRKAFGLEMCEEIKEALADYLYEYRITDIKEKYGSLRWYDAGAPEAVYNIISKYQKISAVTCISCGEPATKITEGWISPYCDKHFPVINKDNYYEIKEGKIIYPEEDD